MEIVKQVGFPNTYSLAKNLAEKALTKYIRPGIRLSMSRPSAITATQKFPFPGWTDSIAAAGAVIYALGRCITSRDLCYPYMSSIFIPCDYVVSAILVQFMLSVTHPEAGFDIIHVCTSEEFKDYKQGDFFIDSHSYLKT